MSVRLLIVISVAAALAAAVAVFRGAGDSDPDPQALADRRSAAVVESSALDDLADALPRKPVGAAKQPPPTASRASAVDASAYIPGATPSGSRLRKRSTVAERANVIPAETPPQKTANESSDAKTSISSRSGRTNRRALTSSSRCRWVPYTNREFYICFKSRGTYMHPTGGYAGMKIHYYDEYLFLTRIRRFVGYFRRSWEQQAYSTVWHYAGCDILNPRYEIVGQCNPVYPYG